MITLGRIWRQVRVHPQHSKCLAIDANNYFPLNTALIAEEQHADP
jgi:hypothetical protein